MRQIPYLTYDSLKRINKSSIKAKRNRNVYFDRLTIDTDMTYPVVFDMIHNDIEVRTRILINAEGESVWLDMSFDEFASLPTREWNDAQFVAGVK